MKILSTILFIGLSIFAQGQNKLSGIITTHLNEPIFGAEIYIEELNKGTSSNENGYYELTNLPNNPIKITVSFIGFETKTITLITNDPKNSKLVLWIKGNVE